MPDSSSSTITGRSRIMVARAPSSTSRSVPSTSALICKDFDYEAFIVKRDGKIPALPAITALGKNSTYNTEIETRNVLFLPR